jgi:hypothetical protein
MNFFFHIPSGTYEILNYHWVRSTWYGNKIFNEPIFKDVNTTEDFNTKIATGQIKEKDLIRFQFTIATDSVNYLGTWHFNTGLVSFTDDNGHAKNFTDGFKINFTTANTVLPQ